MRPLKRYPSATMGNCFIINSIYNQTEGVYSSLRNTSKTGKEFGLKLTLFLDKVENIGLLNHNSGAHVGDQFSVCAPPPPPPSLVYWVLIICIPPTHVSYFYILNYYVMICALQLGVA